MPSGAEQQRQAGSARWEHFAHGADVGLRGLGRTEAEAFEQAALALTALVSELSTVQARERRDVDCSAADHEILLVDWLNALIYLMAVDKMLFSRFDVQIRDDRLIATAWGEPLDPPRHRPQIEPKGATYTMLRVGRDAGGWVAQTVVDV